MPPIVLSNRRPVVQLSLIAVVCCCLTTSAAQEGKTVVLFCQDEKQLTVKFLIDYTRSEVVYLNATDSPMWAAPATITDASIRWKAWIPAAAFRRGTGVIQDRSRGRWPMPDVLDGSIDRTSGRIGMFDYPIEGRVQVPLAGGSSWRWTQLQNAVCRVATQKF